MILYHGSFLEIAKPDLVHSRPNVDFGRGFYVTPLHDQAEKIRQIMTLLWAVLPMIRYSIR